jgi:hypothetical protein
MVVQKPRLRRLLDPGGQFSRAAGGRVVRMSLGPGRQSSLEMLERLVGIPLLVQQQCQLQVDFGVSGAELEGLVEYLSGLVLLSL